VGAEEEIVSLRGGYDRRFQTGGGGRGSDGLRLSWGEVELIRGKIKCSIIRTREDRV